MIKLPSTEKSFHYSGTGETTNYLYAGTFKVKVILTANEQLEIERLYNLFLPNDKNASQSKKILAATLAELQVRIVQGPFWWQQTNYGKDIYDVNILYELLIKINDCVEEWKKELVDLSTNTEEEKNGN